MPLNGDETKRDVIVQWQNTQPELELYLSIDCDASAIVAYKIQITNVHKYINVTTTVSDYKCGTQFRVNKNEGGYVVLVQNSGTSTLSYRLTNIEQLASGSSKGVLIAIVVVAIVIIIVIAYIYVQRRKRLQHDLNQGLPLIHG